MLPHCLETLDMHMLFERNHGGPGLRRCGHLETQRLLGVEISLESKALQIRSISRSKGLPDSKAPRVEGNDESSND